MTYRGPRKTLIFAPFALIIVTAFGFSGFDRIVASEPAPASAMHSGGGQTPGVGSGTWNYQKIGISAPGDQLRLLLVDISSGTDYVVGVRSVDGPEKTLIAGEVRFGNSKSKALHLISQIVDWPRERIDVQPGLIRVFGLSQAVGSVILCVTVPHGTSVSIDTPEGLLARATPASGFMVHNGVTVAQEVQGIRTLVAQLARPGAASNNTRIVKLEADKYAATPKGLADNLVTLAKPAYPASVDGEEIQQVLVRVTIDETGVVSEITPVQGKKEFLEAVLQAVRNWRFRPFSADGKAIPIKASLVFFFGNDRTVSSPIFDELQR